MRSASTLARSAPSAPSITTTRSAPWAERTSSSPGNGPAATTIPSSPAANTAAAPSNSPVVRFRSGSTTTHTAGPLALVWGTDPAPSGSALGSANRRPTTSTTRVMPAWLPSRRSPALSTSRVLTAPTVVGLPA